MLTAAALCGQACAEVVVGEYSGHYVRGDHYDVIPPSIITIYEYHEGYVYDFDAYDNATEPPYEPATIQSITAVRNIGTVEIMVQEHEGRIYGADNVSLLQFNQGGVTGIIKRFNIQGDLGADGPTYAAQVDGEFFALSTSSDITFHEVTASGSIVLVVLEAPRALYVAGSAPGSIRAG